MEEKKKFWQIEPTKIIYKPHCGNCGSPIDTSENEIAYQDVYDYAYEKKLAGIVDTKIYPYKCAHCGATFNTIEIQMPKQLNNIFLG